MATGSWSADIRGETRSEPATDRIRIPAWNCHGSQIIRSTSEIGGSSADNHNYPWTTRNPRILQISADSCNYPQIAVIIREHPEIFHDLSHIMMKIRLIRALNLNLDHENPRFYLHSLLNNCKVCMYSRLFMISVARRQ